MLLVPQFCSHFRGSWSFKLLVTPMSCDLLAIAMYHFAFLIGCVFVWQLALMLGSAWLGAWHDTHTYWLTTYQVWTPPVASHFHSYPSFPFGDQPLAESLEEWSKCRVNPHAWGATSLQFVFWIRQLFWRNQRTGCKVMQRWCKVAKSWIRRESWHMPSKSFLTYCFYKLSV